MMSWIAFLFTLSVIILVHEWGHFIVARMTGVRVERFSMGFGPRLLRIQRGETEYTLSLLPFGGYVKMAGESEEEATGPAHPWEYRGRSIGERMRIVLAGPAVNYLVGFLLFVFIFLVGAPVVTSKVGEVLPDYPAAQAGLKAGDRILSVNGKPVENWEAVTKAIHSESTTIRLEVERAGGKFELQVQPKVEEIVNLVGVKIKVGMIGIVPSDEVVVKRYPIHQAIIKSGERIWFLTTVTFQALWRIATGGLAIKESITGPIGIFYLTSSVAQQGMISLLQLIAVLSTSLGLFNILPIPVLDGGHLLFLTIERFRGKPVSLRAQETVTRVGMGLLVLLLVVVTYNDVIKFKIADRILPFFNRN